VPVRAERLRQASASGADRLCLPNRSCDRSAGSRTAEGPGAVAADPSVPEPLSRGDRERSGDAARLDSIHTVAGGVERRGRGPGPGVVHATDGWWCGGGDGGLAERDTAQRALVEVIVPPTTVLVPVTWKSPSFHFAVAMAAWSGTGVILTSSVLAPAPVVTVGWKVSGLLVIGNLNSRSWKLGFAVVAQSAAGPVWPLPTELAGPGPNELAYQGSRNTRGWGGPADLPVNAAGGQVSA